MDRLRPVGPLDGVRVVDLSRLIPGPFATLCLQGLGATVIKVEDPNGGDYLRGLPPFVPGPDGPINAWFAALNRGKRSVALDLRSDAGKAGLMDLLADADVLVESFRPGVLERLGLPPELLLERFPRLILARLTGWGQTGPMARLPGHDLGFLALAGLLYRNPTVPSIQWADLAGGGLCAALEVTAALYGRDRPGAQHARRHLDIAMLDKLVGLQQTVLAQLASGAPPDEVLTGGNSLYNIYATSDGHVTVAALEPAFLSLFAEQAPGLDADAIATWLGEGTRAEWERRLGEACVVPVLSPVEAAQHPQVIARDLFCGMLPHPPTGPVIGPVPGLGEHTTAELFRVRPSS